MWNERREGGNGARGRAFGVLGVVVEEELVRRPLLHRGNLLIAIHQQATAIP